jgi:hypothetical protein
MKSEKNPIASTSSLKRVKSPDKTQGRIRMQFLTFYRLVAVLLFSLICLNSVAIKKVVENADHVTATEFFHKTAEQTIFSRDTPRK